MLADVQEHREDALLGAGPRVEVVGEHLVQRVAAVVDHDLLAVEVGVPERRGDVEDRARRVGADLVEGHPALQVHQGQREERCVGGHDRQRRRAEGQAAGLERDDDQRLLGEPGERLGLDGCERRAEDVAVARLVAGQVVGDPHAVRVAPAHVVLDEVHGDPVGAPDDVDLFDARAVDLVGDVVLRPVLRAERQPVELFAGGGDRDVDAAFERLAHGRWQGHVRQDGAVGRRGHSRLLAHGGQVARRRAGLRHCTGTLGADRGESLGPWARGRRRPARARGGA